MYTFWKSARWILTAPNTPQEVRDQAGAIAEAGGSKPAVIEFTNFLQLITNGTGAENDSLSENPELTNSDNQEIADAIGFSRPVVSEFVNSIPSVGNGIGADSDVSSENPELANSDDREFDVIEDCRCSA